MDVGATEASPYNSAVLNAGVGFHNTAVDRNGDQQHDHQQQSLQFQRPGGATGAAQNAQEQAAMHESHGGGDVFNQIAHEHAAGQDRNQLASVNNGRRSGTMAMDSVNGRRFNQQGRIG